MNSSAVSREFAFDQLDGDIDANAEEQTPERE